MLIAGVVAFVLEENGVPIAPRSSASCWGMLEENFVTSMIKVRGQSPAVLRATRRGDARRDDLAVWFLPVLMPRLRRLAGA
jgi:hypothetical protein